MVTAGFSHQYIKFRLFWGLEVSFLIFADDGILLPPVHTGAVCSKVLSGGNERETDLGGKAKLPSYLHLWSQALGSTQKNKIADASDGNEFSLKGGRPRLLEIG